MKSKDAVHNERAPRPNQINVGHILFQPVFPRQSFREHFFFTARLPRAFRCNFFHVLTLTLRSSRYFRSTCLLLIFDGENSVRGGFPLRWVEIVVACFTFDFFFHWIKLMLVSVARARKCFTFLCLKTASGDHLFQRESSLEAKRPSVRHITQWCWLTMCQL